MGIDLATFSPDYEVSADKKKLVTELKAAVKSRHGLAGFR
jgi:DNA topoisomerase-1